MAGFSGSASSAGTSSAGSASAGVAGSSSVGGFAGSSDVGGVAGISGAAGSGAAGGSGVAGAGGAVGSAGTSGASAGLSGGAGVSGGLPSALGQGCASDVECGGAPLICVKATDTAWGTGAPPKGLCTLPCSANITCTNFVPGAACYKPGATGYCLEPCSVGDANASKCHDRSEFACEEFSAGADLCAPACNGDVDCGSGNFCDPATGMCVQMQKQGDPEGTACNPTGVDTCKGICLSISTTAAVCADPCSFGSPCLYDSSNKPHGACIGALVLSDPNLQSSVGDLGWCVETCSCTAQCAFPGDKCGAWEGTPTQIAQVTQAFGAPGVCESAPTTELVTCN